jgi:hypothetical protein
VACGAEGADQVAANEAGGTGDEIGERGADHATGPGVNPSLLFSRFPHILLAPPARHRKAAPMKRTSTPGNAGGVTPARARARIMRAGIQRGVR